jgi:ribose transport system permease protein
MIVPIIVTALLAIFLNRTVKGRHLLAVGGNSNAAELSGISVSRTIMLAHGLSGLIAAIAGVLAVAQLGSAQPTIGSDWLIISFAAPIIGGASLSGGSVSITGTVIAVVLIGLIQNAMVLLAVDPYWVTFLLGSLILAAVWINRIRTVRMERSR